MTKQDLRERIACVKDLFEISRMARELCDIGYFNLSDAEEMARQTSGIGMEMWQEFRKEFLEKTPESKTSQKIDRGEHAVVK